MVNFVAVTVVENGISSMKTYTDTKADADFDFVYETGNTFPDYLICKHCKQRVERGIANVATHWVNCEERKEGLIDLRKKV